MAVPVDADGSAHRPIRGPLVVAILAALILGGTAGLLWLRDAEPGAGDVTTYLRTATSPVKERVRTVVGLLMTYEARTLEEKAAQLLAISTGDFEDQYATLVKEGLGAALKSAATRATAEIVADPEVSFATSKDAVALVRVLQTAKVEGSNERRFLYVLKLSMKDVSPDPETSDWRVEHLEVLAQQPR